MRSTPDSLTLEFHDSTGEKLYHSAIPRPSVGVDKAA
jgi:hypothetical protein